MFVVFVQNALILSPVVLLEDCYKCDFFHVFSNETVGSIQINIRRNECRDRLIVGELDIFFSLRKLSPLSFIRLTSSGGFCIDSLSYTCINLLRIIVCICHPKFYFIFFFFASYSQQDRYAFISY